MPIYEYACRDCGEHLEVAQSFKDDPLTECPGCGGRLRKVFGNIGIAFKGSGFYRTDNRPAATSSSGGEAKEAKEAKEPKEVKAGSGGDQAGGASGAKSTGAKAEPGKASDTKDVRAKTA